MKNKFILERPLIYRQHDTLNDFLTESQLWCNLYTLLLKEDIPNHLEIPLVKLFNEVKYQCVYVVLSKNGLNKKEFFDNMHLISEYTLGGCLTGQLYYSMVYAILSLFSVQNRTIQNCCKNLYYDASSKGKYFFDKIKNYVAYELHNGHYYDLDLRAKPESPTVIRNPKWKIYIRDREDIFPFECNDEWWKYQTNSFDQDTIKEIINLWEDDNERLQMKEIIEEAYKRYLIVVSLSRSKKISNYISDTDKLSVSDVINAVREAKKSLPNINVVVNVYNNTTVNVGLGATLIQKVEHLDHT